MCALKTNANDSIHVKFGGICYTIVCRDADIYKMLEETYGVFRSDEPADITVEFDLVNKVENTKIEAFLSQRPNFQWEKLQITTRHACIVGFDAANHRFQVLLEKDAFHTPFKLRPLNRLLGLTYYTASRLKPKGWPPWMLVHSCGIFRKGQVMIFTGPCETGKTTIGRYCRQEYGQTLNDEMMLMSWPHRFDGRVLVQSAPVSGELPFGSNVAAPCSCVFLLKQSQRIAVRRIGRMEAYLRFLRQVISPRHFQETGTREIISIMEEFADKITRITPFYELEFTMDKNLLWDIEERITDPVTMEAYCDEGPSKAG